MTDAGDRHRLAQLPAQLTSFVGRTRELAKVREELGDTRLLTLTGADGVGKTRLALQLAADVVGCFDDGVWWVEVAHVSEPEAVGEALAGVLGVRPMPGRTALEACCRLLVERQALVVLGNCAHPLDGCASCATATSSAG